MIALSYVGGNIFIWNADDASVLREEYRIVGNLVGCHPRAPRQSRHLALPLQLLKEEARLLIDKGICVLVDDSSPAVLPSAGDRQNFERQRKRLYEEQVETAKKVRREGLLQHKDEIIAGKRAKRQKKLEQKKAAGEKVDECEMTKDIEFDVDQIVNSMPPLPEKGSKVQIFLSTHRHDIATLKPLEWNYPQSKQEKLRCRVFKELWEKGYFLTSGTKYGGDFLVYPGDPVRFHSFYIALCMQYEEKIDPLELVTIGRMGPCVKKTILLCSVNEQDQLTYTSLQWTSLS